MLFRRGLVSRALVVAPTTVCPGWVDELKKSAAFPFKTALLLDSNKQKRLDALTKLQKTRAYALQVVIINYESIWREGMFEALQAYNADIIIADESQRIKTPNAKQSEAMHELGSKAAFRLVLSGTPIQNSAVDIFSQYKFLDPTVFGENFYAFRGRYARLGGFKNKQIIGYRDIDKLISKIYSIGYRVTKADALDLPEETFETRTIQLPPAERNIYNKLRRDSVVDLDNGKVTATTVLTKLLRLQQLTGGFLQLDDGTRPEQVSSAKIHALEDILDDYVVETGQKVVVFARFLPEIALIRKLLEEKNLKYGCIFGGVPLSERGEIVKDFQTNPETKVFLAQIQTAGLGITLHAASVAVFYSLDFNYANYSQALARIHRIGQTQPCTYINLIVENSVDTKIIHALQLKKDLAKTIIDDWRSYFTDEEVDTENEQR